MTGSGVDRRGFLLTAAALAAAPAARANEVEDGVRLIRQLTGKTPTESDRVRLMMPAVFPNGYTVPLSVQVESAMTQADHVAALRVLAPKNPLVEVATFRFQPLHAVARVSTRVRLAAPQFVLAVAEMNDGSLLMAKAWVDVATDGCK